MLLYTWPQHSCLQLKKQWSDFEVSIVIKSVATLSDYASELESQMSLC